MPAAAASGNRAGAPNRPVRPSAQPSPTLGIGVAKETVPEIGRSLGGIQASPPNVRPHARTRCPGFASVEAEGSLPMIVAALPLFAALVGLLNAHVP